ncbi:hypothetical protein GJ496_008697 [Pomphorhynchus laevis]|nr:hypothetical protein GJ496_008697 [Pomphorhynchus laevis]
MFNLSCVGLTKRQTSAIWRCSKCLYKPTFSDCRSTVTQVFPDNKTTTLLDYIAMCQRSHKIRNKYDEFISTTRTYPVGDAPDPHPNRVKHLRDLPANRQSGLKKRVQIRMRLATISLGILIERVANWHLPSVNATPISHAYKKLNAGAMARELDEVYKLFYNRQIANKN